MPGRCRVEIAARAELLPDWQIAAQREIAAARLQIAAANCKVAAASLSRCRRRCRARDRFAQSQIAAAGRFGLVDRWPITVLEPPVLEGPSSNSVSSPLSPLDDIDFDGQQIVVAVPPPMFEAAGPAARSCRTRSTSSALNFQLAPSR